MYGGAGLYPSQFLGQSVKKPEAQQEQPPAEEQSED